MAWDVNKIYSLMRLLIRKNQAGGITSGDFFNTWNTEQSAYHSDLVGKWQSRNNGKSGNNTGLIVNEADLTLLAPFIIPGSITLVAGKATKPSDFIYTIASRLLISGTEYLVNKINHGQINYVNGDVIDPPSVTDGTYYMVEYEGYYLILPIAATGSLKLDYIAAPNDVVWSYTFDANARQVYNPSGIQGCDVIYGGVGYTSPTITFSAPAVGGVQATGTLTVVAGVITAIVMTNTGYGYSGLSPTATITGSSTTPAVLSSPIISVQPKWNQNTIIEITKRSLTSLGVSFKDKDFEAFGERNTITGDS